MYKHIPIQCEDREDMYLYRGHIIMWDPGKNYWIGITPNMTLVPIKYPVIYGYQLALDVMVTIDDYWESYGANRIPGPAYK